MSQSIQVNIELDKRSTKKDGTNPVKLRVYNSETTEQKRYGTRFSFNEKEFNSIWKTSKPRSEYKEKRLKLIALETTANEIANKLPVFSFEDFERLMFGKTNTELNINYYYEKQIQKHTKLDSHSTASSYDVALKCLLRFYEKPNLGFNSVTISFLEQFEKFCTEKEGKSITTVGIYLRTLRTVFNEAINDKIITQDIYPFGKRKYQIKASKNIKKALTKEQLKKLLEGQPLTPEQEKAKAFWFFSYVCNGMNIKDIVNLKYKNIGGDTLTFLRAKTSKSSKTPTPITVNLIDFTKDVINKYGNTDKHPENYIFPILNNTIDTKEQKRKKDAFTRSINQNFLKYAKNLGIDTQISTYHARHTFSTIAIQKGASMEMVGGLLGHTDMKTTMNYFAGFESSETKKLTEKLLDF